VNNLLASIRSKKSATQLLSYGLIGIFSNLTAYLVYLLVTYSGGTPKLTMSVLYVATALVSYIANRKLTFAHKGSVITSGTRFFIAHCFGYLINLALLFFMVDRLGYPHQLVQIFAVFVVAAFLFVTFKFFVFREEGND
jgi:putative flippase GtrA